LNLAQLAVALTPIIAVLVLLVALRMPATRAMPIAFVALVVALLS
jgi:L-lactate permease